MSIKILAIDDEINILTLLRMNLEMNSYSVITANGGVEGLELALSEMPDLILLDLMMPDIDGITVCKRLKSNQHTQQIPIVMLTALVNESDKVEGLDSGADYYLTKPFGIKELVAVVRAVLRRNNVIVSEETTSQYDGLVVDQDRMKVSKNNHEIDLTHMEMRLLLLLMDNREKVMERKKIIESLAMKLHTPDIRSIDVHIWNIRKKLNTISPSREYIETIRGVGYRFK